MKKVLLFFIMVLLVFVSARSLLSADSRRGSPYEIEAKSLRLQNNVARQEYYRLKSNLDQLVSSDLDEMSLQSIVELLDIECRLVKSLLSSKTGQDVDSLLSLREKTLSKATQSARLVYNAVMNFATSDVLFSGKHRHVALGTSLHGATRRNYLKRVRKVLAQYREEFSNKQYYISQRALGILKDRLPQYADTRDPYFKSDVRHCAVDYSKRYFPSKPFPSSCRRISKQSFSHSSNVDSYDPRAQYKGGLKSNSRGFYSGFMDLQDEIVAKMQKHAVINLIDDVLMLVRDEIRRPFCRYSWTDEPKHDRMDYHDVRSSIDAFSPVIPISRRAQRLFDSICNAAEKDATKMGYWHHDLYERNLEFYANRLENIKKRSLYAVNEFKDRLQENCQELQNTLDGLFGSVDGRIFR